MRVHWTKVTTVGSCAPSGREGHAASLSNGRVYTFGGLENGTRVAKLQSFDLQRHRWFDEGRDAGANAEDGRANGTGGGGGGGGSKLSVGGISSGGKSEADADDADGGGKGEVPPPRCYHGSWVVGHRLLYFGGEGATSNPVPGSASMSMSGSASALPSLKATAGFKASQVFSDPATQRRTRRVCFDDVVLYNTIDGTWEVVKSGLAPLPRKGHTCTLVGSGGHDAQVVVFGGEPSGKGAPMSDIHTVSVGSLLSGVAMWEKPRPLGDVPAPRHGHTAVALVGESSSRRAAAAAGGNTLTRGSGRTMKR